MLNARPARAAMAVALLVAWLVAEPVAAACPACAAAGNGAPRWLVGLLIAVPALGFAVTALVVRKLLRSEPPR